MNLELIVHLESSAQIFANGFHFHFCEPEPRKDKKSVYRVFLLLSSMTADLV